MNGLKSVTQSIKAGVTALVVTVLVLSGTGVRAATDIRNYVFGNSLINHPTDSQKTNVPYWLYQLAKEAGHSYAVDGQWGFLRNFAQDLPPTAQWSFPRVNDVWAPERQGFADAEFNTILLNPTNFIQYQAADVPYEGENPEKTSPLSATLKVFDWVAGQAPDARFYIFEGWADMGTFGRGFPPSHQAYRKYLNYNTADYHNWYLGYISALRQARPELDIRLIPVAAILAGLLRETELAKISITDIYLDDAPHGTETLYFLASLITYKALFGENAPVNLKLPDILHPVLRDNYTEVLAYIDTETTRLTAGLSGLSDIRFVGSESDGTGTLPLAMGLNGISDWSTQHPFVDIMKTARPWIGHLPGQWGGWEAADLEKSSYLDAYGWPKEIPPELSHVETFILSDQPKEAISLVGKYRLNYKGRGKIRIGGRARPISYKEGEIWFSYRPGEDVVGISILETDPEGSGDYIRDISVVREDQIALFEAGVVFNPRWTQLIRGLQAVRFMDWMSTNGSEISNWDQRPRLSDYTYVRRGVPVETMVALANELGTDPWFNMPHQANDEFVRRFAIHVEHHLDTELKAYVEYSNEMWNFIFQQAHWAGEQARERWGEAGEDGWVRFAGARAAEITQIWRVVFGQTADDRLVRVIATHTHWPGLEEVLFEGAGQPVSEVFDAYAVTGYFALGTDTEPQFEKVLQWIADSTKAAVKAGEEKGWSGPRLKEFVKTRRFDQAVPLLAASIRSGSLSELVDERFPYHAEVAARNGLELIMYEGGTHVVGLGEFISDETLTELFNYFNYTPEIAELYRDLLVGWHAAGGSLFNAFVDVAAPGRFGSWGALRHLDDSNPRWDVLMRHRRQQDQ
ncbi:MAG: calcium-binding protein [Rhodobacteraceae bacterium]|nr:calcium-binding protein [Paracoccaceae bacterium]